MNLQFLAVLIFCTKFKSANGFLPALTSPSFIDLKPLLRTTTPTRNVLVMSSPSSESLPARRLLTAASAPLPSHFFNFAPGFVILQSVIDAIFFGSKALLSNLPYYLLVFTTLDLLRDAEHRNRLNGTTFKILYTCTAVSTLMFLHKAITNPGALLSTAKLWEQTTIFRVPLSRLPLAASFCSCVLAALQNGPPLPKLQLTGPYHFLPPLYILSIIPAVILAKQDMRHAIPLLIGTLVALHGAATVGPKRLSSSTYFKLNTMMCCFFSYAAGAQGMPLGLLFAVPTAIGAYRGASHKE